jgi:xanthine dehydrogenase accessory factor
MDAVDEWDATDASLYGTLESCLSSRGDAAVASVVQVEGSAYRRPGAKMVVVGEGETRGAITAGCLEDRVAELARGVVETGEPTVERFDLTDDADGTWGMGLGCNGVVDVLVEPVDASLRPALDALARKEPVAVLTALDADAPGVSRGDRTLLLPDAPAETAARPSLPESVVSALRDRAATLRAEGAAETLTVETDDGSVTVFVDGLAPVPDLLVFGHGPDVRPVARLGSEAGFRVVVASARGAKADPDTFPAADAVQSVRAPDAADAVTDPVHTYAVVMSHNFLDDRLALASLLDAGVPHVGLMGPGKRFEEIREAMAEDGRSLDADELDRIATPVGLDLGGGTPTEIAFAIVSEAIAVRHGRDGGRLSESEGPIHTRPDDDGS